MKKKFVVGKSNEKIKDYFSKNYKNTTRKINFCLKRANDLIENEFYGSALTISFTALELIIRNLYLKPLVRGTFISNDWAEIIEEYIFSNIEGKSKREQNLLKDILKQWDFYLAEINIPKGDQLWESIKNTKKVRNEFVHNAGKVTKDNAEISVECANVLLQIIEDLINNLGIEDSINN